MSVAPPVPEQSESSAPTIGDVVMVRGQRWVVAGTDAPVGSGHTLLSLQSVEDGRYGDTIEVIWEVEPARRVLKAKDLPEVRKDRFDAPEQLAAFLDAIRWSAVTSADVRTLQSPFRSGVAIEDYQLEPVARAVDAPRVNLLMADDVGLGKTVEAGLVAQELLLRHRAKRIMIICPAGLTLKWKDEMAEKFGLDFVIVDSQQCALLRRTHGSAANPFMVYPLVIVSLPWLRGPKASRLIDEVLPPDPTMQARTFDLLILDEAHHVAPAAPKQVYAVDSQQTRLMRRLAPHFTHRLFLSATPHNGYPASFTALLEILDDQRFARGVPPEKTALKETVIRRLKRDIVNADGTARFKIRQSSAIPVTYPQSEREIHALLVQFADLRRRRNKNKRGRKATDLVTLLLKKRLFSSPEAFARTVAVYRQTLKDRARAHQDEVIDEIPAWLAEFDETAADLDDEELATAEDDAVDRAGALQVSPENAESELLERMERWALSHTARADAKATALIQRLKEICLPDGKIWADDRVVVFTEYRDTQNWLAGLLGQEQMGGDRVALLHGGIVGEDREQLRLGFQAPPDEQPVRILIATDAASEGIDLQNYCHRLINYDIPFNPNKLEQRIGRVDRYGQTHDPQIQHFVGTGWEGAVDSYEADLEFLSRVATKVARMEADLGPVNAVLSDAVQRRMLGERVTEDVVEKAGKGKDNIAADSDVGDQVRRLRANLDETVAELGITPARIQRVVATALVQARQQPLVKAGPGQFEVPPLTGSWQWATNGLMAKLRKENEQPRQLPVTFDPDIASGKRDDVVLAHLNHPLVAMSTRLLRGAAATDDTDLSRVTAVVSENPELKDVLVAAYSRFVLVGADGVRLHEEVLQAGGWLREDGGFARVEGIGALRTMLDTALESGRAVSPAVQERLLDRWERLLGSRSRVSEEGVNGLVLAMRRRAEERQKSLISKLAQRQEQEQNRISKNLDEFAGTLRSALSRDEEEAEDALFSTFELDKTREELAQYRRDREQWQLRLNRLEQEKDLELQTIAHRYADPQPHLFPVAMVFVVPRQEATR